MTLGRNAALNQDKMRGDPCQIEGREGAEQVTTIDGSQSVGEHEVVDDARPQAVSDAKGFLWHDRETLESKKRLGGSTNAQISCKFE